jgi:plastocyanin
MERPVSRRGFLRAAAGATAVAGASGSAAAASEGETSGEGGEATTHTVDMTNGLVFEPDSLTIAPGDTVVFENVGSVGHSVTAYEENIPEGAEYWASGGFDSEDAARSAYSATGSLEDTGNVAGGESWEHTFETEGVHEYFCVPHEAGGGGMVAQIEVGAGAAPGDGDGSLPIGVPGLIFGGLGIGIASFLSGMYYGGKRNGEEQSTAALAGIGVVALGIVLLIAVVANLLVTG